MKNLSLKMLPLIVLMSGMGYSNGCFSQVSRNEKGLLWEISGNNMKSPSYLYGTMHVSNKIAFNLCDTFFSAINRVDVVALEINDEDFISDMASEGLLNYYFDDDEYSYYSESGSFYNNAFKLKFPDPARFFDQTYLYKVIINHLLYRFDNDESDYEENTYLDMYVYQVGKKLNKKIQGLETYEEFLGMKYKSSLPTDEKSSYMPRRGRMERELFEKSYRNGDICLLDSLNNLGIAEGFKKYILLERNRNFARRIDSIIRSGHPIFAAFGAAHLGGKEGVICLLRAMGYQVRPVSMTVTKKGRNNRDKYEKIIYPVKFQRFTMADSMLSVSLPGVYLEHSSSSNIHEYFYPDLANGAYYSILRINTFAPLFGKSAKDILASIDSILYFNIPGKIISKIEVKKNDCPGLEIVNITRRGDYQKYAFYVTATEILVFKMNCSENYFKLYSDIFFNNIFLMKNKNSGISNCDFSPKGFNIDLPHLKSVSSSSDISSTQKLMIQSYDDQNNNFYFLLKASLPDYRYIEEDSFELNYLSDLFLEQFNLKKDTSYSLVYEGYPSLDFIGNTEKGLKIYARMLIRGADYYLYGIMANSQADAVNYLNSFCFIPTVYQADFNESRDTFMHFSVIKPDDRSKYEKIDETYDALLAYFRAHSKKNKSNNSYSYNYYGRYKEKIIGFRETGEQFRMRYDNYDKYDVSINKDSFWKHEIRFLNRNNSLIIKKKNLYMRDSCEVLDLELTDTNSAREICHRLILKGIELYTLSYLKDTFSRNEGFYQSVLETFKPFGSIDSSGVFSSRLDAFIKDVNGDTNSRKTALENVKYLKPDSTQVDKIISLIRGMGNSETENMLKSALLRKMAGTKTTKILPFLEEYYYRLSDTANLEYSILTAVAGINSAKSAAVFLRLAAYDLPLGNSNSIELVFDLLKENPEISVALFPEILKFTRYPDYKDEIYELLAVLVRDKKISKSQYAREIPFICQDAVDELKRKFSKSDNDNYYDRYNSYESEYPVEYFADENRYYNYDRYENNISGMPVYVTILMPFYDVKQVRKFFDRLMRTASGELKMDVCVAMLANGMIVSDSIVGYYASNKLYKIRFYEKLKAINRLEVFKSCYLNQLDFVNAMIYNKVDPDNNDSVIFMFRKLLKTRENTGYVYYFKRKNPKTGNWFVDYAGIQPQDTTMVTTKKYILAYNQPLLLAGKESNAVPSAIDINRVVNESQKKFRLIGRKRAIKSDNDYIY